MIPVKIAWSHAQGLRISVGSSVKTPIGVFSIDYTQELMGKMNERRPMTINHTNVSKSDLLVVIRDRNKTVGQDEIYRIENGRYFEIDTDGKANIQIREGLVIVDITHVDNFFASLNPNKSSCDAKIAYLLSNYYKNLALNRHEEAGRIYASRIKRYYNLTGTDRRAVVAQLAGYDEMFNVYGKRFDIQWNSLQVTEYSDIYSVTYLINYSIERYDTSLPTYFEIRMFVEMNKQFEIVAVYEEILRKE